MFSAEKLLQYLVLLMLLSAMPALADFPEFKEIAPGVFLRPGVQEVANPENHGHIANVGFVVGNEAVAMIDSGGSYDEGKALLQEVERLTKLPVRWLILTHMHPDHVLGAAAFAERGITIVGHKNLPDAMRNRQDAYIGPAKMYQQRDVERTRIVLPSVTVTPGETFEIDLGGRVLELEAHPTAHTNNDLTIFDRQTSLLWASDLLFVERIPVIDGSVLGWLKVMDDLAAKSPALLVPGHGPLHLDWEADLAKQRDYLNRVVAGVRETIAKGGDLRLAVNTVGQDMRGDWLLFDDYHGRNVTAAFVELEWE